MILWHSVIKWIFSYKACIMSEAVVLGRGQLYRPEATSLCSWSRPNTTVRGHNTGFIWKYPFYDTFINQWLKITVCFLFFRCGHNYRADQDLIQLHDDLIHVLLDWHPHKVFRNLWKICFVHNYMLFAINTAVMF